MCGPSSYSYWPDYWKPDCASLYLCLTEVPFAPAAVDVAYVSGGDGGSAVPQPDVAGQS